MNPNARTWSKTTAFKRDIIVAVLRLGGRPGADAADRPYGLAIKRELEVIRDEDLNHGRLYPNLDDLVDANLLIKGKRDNRTNTYHATGTAVEAFRQYLSEYAGLRHQTDDVANGPRGAYDRQTSKAAGGPN